MHPHIVHDDHVARSQGWCQHLLHIGAEELSVHGPLQQQRRGDAIVSQGGDEGQGSPGAKGYLADQTLSSRRPAAAAHHVGSDSSLVDKDPHAIPGRSFQNCALIGRVRVPWFAATHAASEEKSTTEDHLKTAAPPLLIVPALPIGAPVDMPGIMHS